MEKIKNILKDYTYLASASVISIVLRMISLFILTGYLLNPSEFGLYSTLLAIANFMVFFVNWIFPSLVRFGREDMETGKGLGTTFWSGFSIAAVFTILTLLSFVLWGKWIF